MASRCHSRKLARAFDFSCPRGNLRFCHLVLAACRIGSFMQGDRHWQPCSSSLQTQRTVELWQRYIHKSSEGACVAIAARSAACACLPACVRAHARGRTGCIDVDQRHFQRACCLHSHLNPLQMVPAVWRSSYVSTFC